MSDDTLSAFYAYAQAFEAGYAADDWQIVDRQLSDDIGWAVGGVAPPLGGVWHGRAATLQAIRQSCGSFDRRFDARQPRIVDGPRPIPGGVHFVFVVTYRRAGLPPVELEGVEWDFFRDGKLEFHRERLLNVPTLLQYLERHGAHLLPER